MSRCVRQTQIVIRHAITATLTGMMMTNPRRRIDSPPQRYLRRQGLDSYDNSTRRNNLVDGDATGDYSPTQNQQSGSEDGGDGNRYDNSVDTNSADSSSCV